MKKTIVINLIGGPGTGKTTFATNLFTKMKQKGISCEFVEEFAKGLVWEGREFALKDQLYIFANQNHNLLRVKGKVNVIITDSPLLLSIYYNSILPNEYKLKEGVFNKFVLNTFNSFENLVYLMQRNFDYVKEGRYQSEEESTVIQKEIESILKKENIEYEKIYGNEESLNKIVSIVEVLLSAYKKDSKEKEIERRFLLKGKEILSIGLPGVEIKQTYLKIGQTEKRVRKIGEDKFFFTEKEGEGALRDEYESEISEENYNFLKDRFSFGKEVEKTRYEIPIKGAKKCEINVFNQPKDLQLVEVEFDSLKQMEKFIAPAWFGEEVTNDKSYNSFNLATEK